MEVINLVTVYKQAINLKIFVYRLYFNIYLFI